MMIKDYSDDKAMAEYGRYCAKWKAVREAKESIRDAAVMLGNTIVVDEVNEHFAVIQKAVADVIEALEL
jgi:hypothetical protein